MGCLYRFRGNIPTGISLNRYGRLYGTVSRGKRNGVFADEAPGLTTGPWQDAVNRLLRIKERPDPRKPEKSIRWNQGNLAEVAGIRGNSLSDILRGRRQPTLDSLNKIAIALGVPLWTMFVTDRQAILLESQQEQDDVMTRRASIHEEARTIVAELMGPVTEQIAETLLARREPKPEAPKPQPHQVPAPMKRAGGMKKR